MSNYTDKLAEVRGYTAYTLNDMADCMSPDSSTSVGALFLARVRDDVLERVQEILPEDMERETEDLPNEIADSAVPVYTGEKWAVFADLGAYQEDISDLSDTQDFDDMSNMALYAIAERLVSAILGELVQAIEEDDNEA